MSVLTLRPNAAGDETSIDHVQYTGGETQHWETVKDISPNDITDYVYTQSTTYLRDLYNLPNHTTESGVINSVTIYFRISSTDATHYVYAKPSQKSGDTVTDGLEVSEIGAETWTTFSQTWTINPGTEGAYTWDEIDALQIGLQIKGESAYYGCCTQVYVEVNYTPSEGDGDIQAIPLGL